MFKKNNTSDWNPSSFTSNKNPEHGTFNGTPPETPAEALEAHVSETTRHPGSVDAMRSVHGRCDVSCCSLSFSKTILTMYCKLVHGNLPSNYPIIDLPCSDSLSFTCPFLHSHVSSSAESTSQTVPVGRFTAPREALSVRTAKAAAVDLVKC